MPGWFGPSGDCGCECAECTCEDARSHFIAGGLSTFTLSGGLNFGTALEVDSPRTTCQGGAPGTTPIDLTFDLSGSSAKLFRTDACTTDELFHACVPSGSRPVNGWFNDKVCTASTPVNDFSYRGFWYRSQFSCASGYTSGFLAASVQFRCVGGSYKYKLRIYGEYIGIRRHEGVPAPTVPAWDEPTTGTDWTYSVVGSDQKWVRNGSVAEDDWASFAIGPNPHTGGISGSYLAFFDTHVVTDSITTLSLWMPNPSVDYTGISESGTVTLS